MSFDICVILAILLVVLVNLVVVLKKRRLLVKAGARCLLVVAHPDDECMFFGPTIVSLLAQQCKVYILCVSTGDCYGQGTIRKQEMFNACESIGISRSDVTVMDIDDMKDGMKTKWETEKLARIVLQYMERLDAKVVITFDESGTSKHPNHISCFMALQYLYTNGWIPSGTQVFVLETVRVLRKYIGILDLVPSHLTSTFLCLSGPLAAWKGMKAHKSQLVWFRYLYLVFSRYVVINSLKRISLHRYCIKKRK
ncbi:unnamed protein product [Bursaphelenchus okinawaensis]|uniref:N-acetylglucosaminylphosphatidylinositol deacetylase n=1 Tax=Bursaphelenchus okinawaensis TaxID=465554 RepID=A0A811JRS7_9BILA|nr:unnamed protein product [Bursaphelenchus okinawaensis]CAG9080645.1 unnamed protein product [Bursaphelenchus okinawaensis]